MLDYIFSLQTLWWLILLLYLPCCVALIVIVLLQKGKGVGFAGAFGVGPGSETLFGPRGARTLPQQLTYVAAGLFMILALLMSTISGKLGKGTAPEMVEEAQVYDSAAVDALLAPAEEEAEGAEAAETATPGGNVSVTPVTVTEDSASPVSVELETATEPAAEEAAETPGGTVTVTPAQPEEAPAEETAEAPAEEAPAPEEPAEAAADQSAAEAADSAPAEAAPAEEAPAPEEPSEPPEAPAEPDTAAE
mgnify:CR=1 FL=1